MNFNDRFIFESTFFFEVLLFLYKKFCQLFFHFEIYGSDKSLQKLNLQKKLTFDAIKFPLPS